MTAPAEGSATAWEEGREQAVSEEGGEPPQVPGGPGPDPQGETHADRGTPVSAQGTGAVGRGRRSCRECGAQVSGGFLAGAGRGARVAPLMLRTGSGSERPPPGEAQW